MQNKVKHSRWQGSGGEEMAVRALVARHVARPGGLIGCGPELSRHVRSGTSPFAGCLKWRPETTGRPLGLRPRQLFLLVVVLLFLFVFVFS